MELLHQTVLAAKEPSNYNEIQIEKIGEGLHQRETFIDESLKKEFLAIVDCPSKAKKLLLSSPIIYSQAARLENKFSSYNLQKIGGSFLGAYQELRLVIEEGKSINERICKTKIVVDEIDELFQLAKSNPRFDFKDSIESLKIRVSDARIFMKNFSSMSHSQKRRRFPELIIAFKKLNFYFPKFEEMLILYEKDEKRIANIQMEISDPSKTLHHKISITKRIKGFKLHKSTYIHLKILNNILFLLKADFKDFELIADPKTVIIDYLRKRHLCGGVLSKLNKLCSWVLDNICLEKDEDGPQSNLKKDLQLFDRNVVFLRTLCVVIPSKPKKQEFEHGKSKLEGFELTKEEIISNKMLSLLISGIQFQISEIMAEHITENLKSKINRSFFGESKSIKVFQAIFDLLSYVEENKIEVVSDFIKKSNFELRLLWKLSGNVPTILSELKDLTYETPSKDNVFKGYEIDDIASILGVEYIGKRRSPQIELYSNKRDYNREMSEGLSTPIKQNDIRKTSFNSFGVDSPRSVASIISCLEDDDLCDPIYKGIKL